MTDLMKAAVVTSFDEPPHFMSFNVPEPDDGQTLLDVVAVGIHPRVRSGAAGRHYTSTGTLPMIPGIDGVARRTDGTLVYFAAHDDVLGTMAEKAVVDARRCIELPSDADAATVAAVVNPAMSSWVALRKRVPLKSGQRVLILGATGNAGAMAVQIAKHLGAGEVIGVGRDPERLARLATLGADRTVRLASDATTTDHALAQAASEVDIVIDYLWGEPAKRTMIALLSGRPDRSKALDWIQIGAIAGAELTLPSVALRSANLRIQGVGQGAMSGAGYLAELPSLIDKVVAGSFALETITAPLADVESVWIRPESPSVRTVLLP
jgi:NADPH:quinone reductase-like Zn-dependent oxidoreductase